MTPADPVPSLNGPTRFDLYHGERICKHFDGAGWCLYREQLARGSR
jgi:hypothetical protein